MKFLQTSFWFNGKPTIDRYIENDNKLKLRITTKERQKEYELSLDLIRLELETLKHEIKGN